MATNSNLSEGTVPRPPPLRPTWTTWMWLTFAVFVAALTVVGLILATNTSWQ